MLLLEPLGELAFAWLPFRESDEPPLPDLPWLPPEPLEALVFELPVPEPLASPLGATGIVDSPAPLEPDELALGLPPPLLPPTPGNADPY